MSGLCPREVLLVGVVPKSAELGCKLTETVQAAVEPAIAAILAELERLGAAASPRRQAAKPSIWWEETVS
jgi:hydrogenase maturation protease